MVNPPILPSLPQVNPSLPQSFSETIDLNQRLQANKTENLPKVEKQEQKPISKESARAESSDQTASVSAALNEKEEVKSQPRENRITGFFKRVFEFLFRR